LVGGRRETAGVVFAGPPTASTSPRLDAHEHARPGVDAQRPSFLLLVPHPENLVEHAVDDHLVAHERTAGGRRTYDRSPRSPPRPQEPWATETIDRFTPEGGRFSAPPRMTSARTDAFAFGVETG